MYDPDNRNTKLFFAILAVIICCLLCCTCAMMGGSVFLINQLERGRPIYDDTTDPEQLKPEQEEGFVPGHYLTEVSFGEPFELDGLEITFIDDVMFEGHDGGIFYVPVTVRNLTEQPIDLGTIEFTQIGPSNNYYDSDGQQMDASFARAGRVMGGALVEAFFVFNDDGDGEYAVQFTHTVSPTGTMETIRVTLPISR